MTTKTQLVKTSDIIRYADRLATAIRRNLSWSRKLKGTVIVEKPKETKGGVSISISVGKYALDPRGKPLSGMARAFEYGSGIHATRGKRGKYRIAPFRARALAFNWAKGEANINALYSSMFKGKQTGSTTNKFLGRAPDGRLMFRYVDHPGVRPRHYIARARAQVKESSRKELALAIRNNIKNEIGLVIKGMKK